MSGRTVHVEVVASVADIPADDWNRCAAEGDGPVDPFIDHAFFLALERSGSAIRETGWAGHHLVARDGAGGIVGVAPCYLKSHSRGEYVFDQGWAEAYERAGGRYYPKLQASVPFTPATGRRLLTPPGPDAPGVRSLLARAAAEATTRRGASSLHVTFARSEDMDALIEEGFLERTDTQFHFINAGYDTFEAFLGALASRKRKLVRRERRDALAGRGLTIRLLSGGDLTEGVWDAFFAFYMNTGARKWGRPYLTRAFFSMIGAAMADRILLVMAERDGRYVAGAINFIGADVLYGRHWGAVEEHPFLHFEVCYYQAIEYAIARGLKRVEAGAQGEHKLARGYRPVQTRSAHYIVDPAFRRAVADYLDRERRYVAGAIEELDALGPFRKAVAEQD